MRVAKFLAVLFACCMSAAQAANVGGGGGGGGVTGRGAGAAATVAPAASKWSIRFTSVSAYNKSHDDPYGLPLKGLPPIVLYASQVPATPPLKVSCDQVHVQMRFVIKNFGADFPTAGGIGGRFFLDFYNNDIQWLNTPPGQSVTGLRRGETQVFQFDMNAAAGHYTLGGRFMPTVTPEMGIVVLSVPLDIRCDITKQPGPARIPGSASGASTGNGPVAPAPAPSGGIGIRRPIGGQ